MGNYRGIVDILVIFALFGNLSTSYAQDTEQPRCGQTHPTGVQKRVVSGTTALPGAWPWQALLLFSYRKTFVCSGALIHPSWILTAAHCVKDRSGTFYVRLGEFDRTRYEGHEQTIKVKKIVVHPRHDYPTRRNNDLAMIKLERPAVITKWVGTACLPTAADFLHGKLVCYATGWGLTRKSYTYSRKLQQAHVPLVTKYKCRQRHQPRRSYWLSHQTRVTNEMLCGGDDTTGASTCLGDSGGPYVCRNPEGYWVLQGITSWGSKKCRVSERYSVFAKVQVFTAWINSVMNGTNDSERPSKITRTHRTENTTWAKLFRKWLATMLRG